MCFSSKNKSVFIILGFIFLSLAYSADRVVLLELFTSSTCGPCFYANAYLDSTYSSDMADISLIRYHTWWPAPGNDPFYLDNPEQNRARASFYNIDAVPTLVIDGDVRSESYTSWGRLIASRRSISSPVKIYADMSSFGIARIKLFAEEGFPAETYRLFFVVVEDSIRYNAPNGQRIFHQVMRAIFPTSSGKQIFVEPGETTRTEINYYLKPEWNIINTHAVIFIQNEFSRIVYQSLKAEIPPQPENAYYVEIPSSKEFVERGDSIVLPFKIINTGAALDTYNVWISSISNESWEVGLFTMDGEEYDSICISGDILEFYIRFRAPSRGGTCYATVRISTQSGLESEHHFGAVSNIEFLVFDDTPRGNSVFKPFFDSLGVEYGLWKTISDGEPYPSFLGFRSIIWDCGESRNLTLLPEQENYLRRHLNSGGTLVLTGSGLGAEIGNDAFYRVFLGANFVGTQSGHIEILGASEDSIAAHLFFAFDTRFAEYITPAPHNICIFRYSDGECAAIRGSRAGFVYLAFNLNEAQPDSTRKKLVRRLFNWMQNYTYAPSDQIEHQQDFRLAVAPNPFNSPLRIELYAPKEEKISLTIHNLLGEIVSHLYSGFIKTGTKDIVWDPSGFSSGVYFVVLKANEKEYVHRVILLK